METRIEKYASYRKEILSSNNLLENLELQSNLVSQYKEKINDIDINILNDLKQKQQLVSLVSSNNNKNVEVNQLVHYLKNIDEKKMNTINEEVEKWHNSYQHKMIIDSNTGIDQNWLSEDMLYKNFNNIKEHIDMQKECFANFQKNSISQTQNINDLPKIIEDKKMFEEIQHVNEYIYNKKTKNKVAYLIPCILSVAFAITIIGLLAIIISRIA